MSKIYLNNNSQNRPLFRKHGRGYFNDWDIDATFTICETLVAVSPKDIQCNGKIKTKILGEYNHFWGNCDNLFDEKGENKLVFKVRELKENENKSDKMIWKDHSNRFWVLKPIPVSAHYKNYIYGEFKEKDNDGIQYLRIYKIDENQVHSSWIAFTKNNFISALMGLSSWNESENEINNRSLKKIA
jgi:hypothetical protein